MHPEVNDMVLVPICSGHRGDSSRTPDEDLALTRAAVVEQLGAAEHGAAYRHDDSSPNAKTCQLPAPADTLLISRPGMAHPGRLVGVKPPAANRCRRAIADPPPAVDRHGFAGAAVRTVTHGQANVSEARQSSCVDCERLDPRSIESLAPTRRMSRAPAPPQPQRPTTTPSRGRSVLGWG